MHYYFDCLVHIYLSHLFLLFSVRFAKKEDIKDFWLAQGLNEAIPLLEASYYLFGIYDSIIYICLIILRETHVYSEHLTFLHLPYTINRGTSAKSSQ